MGFFDFLKPVEHAASSVEHGAFNFLKPVGGVVSGLVDTVEHPSVAKGVALAQSIPRGVVQIRQSAAHLVDPNNPTTGDVTPPTSGIGHALLGNAPIPTIQSEFAKTKQETGSTAQASGQALLSFLGDYAGGEGAVKGLLGTGELAAKGAKAAAENATPLNQVGAIGKDVTPENLNALSKADTLKDVHKELTDIVPPAVAEKIAPAILETKDPGVIDNIITRAVAPETPSIQPTELTPTPAPVVAPEVQPPAPEPVIPQGEPAASEVGLNNTPGIQPRGFTESVAKSEAIAPEVKDQVQSAYTPKSNDVLQRGAEKTLNKGLSEATQTVEDNLGKPLGAIKDQEVQDAFAVAHAHQAQGTEEGFNKAIDIYQRLAQHGTELGRAVQAFSLDKNTPAFLQYWATKTLKKANVPIEGELKDQLNAAFDNIRTNPDKVRATADLQKLVNSNLPSSFTDKAFAVWRAGLLTGPQTVAKIVTSHIVHGGLEDLKDVPAAAVDKFISLFTGNRTLTSTERGSASGAKEGVAAGKELFTSGRDINPGSNASELRQSINFGKGKAAKVFQTYVDTVGNIHGSLYKPFYGKAYAQSVYKTAQAEAKNRHLTGADKEDFIQSVVNDPSADVVRIAKRDAENATFQQETALGNIASAIQKKGGIIGKVIAPFTRIPSAIATDLFNYSPAGLAKSIVDGIKAAKSDEGLTFETQRQLSQGIGRGLTGSAIILPGVLLYNKGLMTLDYPTDPKEQKLWQLEGKIPNAVKVGGQWRSLGAIGPGGSVLSIGGHMAKSLQEGNDFGSALLAGFSGGARSIEEQSYLQGISGALNAVNEPGRYAPNFIKAEAGSVIPTISNTAASATDQYSRQTNSPLDAIKNRVPFARETLPAKVNALGKPVLNGETGLEKLFDPFQSSTVRTSPEIQELRRLQDAGQGILPSTIQKKTTFSGVNTQLTPDQQRELTKSIGDATIQRWHKIISNPGYQHMTDQQKSARLKSSFDVVATHQKIIFAKQNKVGRYSPNYATNRKQAKANKKFVAKQGG